MPKNSNQSDEPTLEPTEEPTQAPTEEPAQEVEQVEVRVLTNCQLGKANSITTLPAGSVNALQALGYIDAHPDAVAYAKSLNDTKGE